MGLEKTQKDVSLILYLIKEQTSEIITAALQQDPTAVKYIKKTPIIEEEPKMTSTLIKIKDFFKNNRK